MTTIICAVDESTAAAAALETASAIADRSGARLLVAHVQPAIGEDHAPEQALRARGIVTEALRRHAPGAAARVRGMVGDATEELSRLATDSGASMIVLGGRHKGRAGTTFRSRLARELAATSPIPIVLAPHAPAAVADTITVDAAEPEPVVQVGQAERRERRGVRRWAESGGTIRPRPMRR
jgi:nucleotide-binding universal stress UspA family protein